jgi:hypothetical protein
MKRFAVALAVTSLAAVSLGVTATAPVGAAAAGTTTVFVANAFSYASGHPFGGTFCVNGTALSSATETEEVDGPFTVDSGPADVIFYDVDNATCGAAEPNAEATVDLPDGGSVTLMASWSNEQNVVMLVDPLDCVDAGMGRLTVRNGANSRGGSVDVWGTGPGGVSTLLLSGVNAPDQGSVDLPVGDYTDLFVTEVGDTAPIWTIPDLSIQADTGSYVYLYGGNDGPQGSFLGPDAALAGCTVPTTALASTTTTAPPAAQAVQATPAFTG